jgi:uncharacterized Zn-finger protein
MTGYQPQRTPGVTPEEVIEVTSRSVACDGGKGALGHPRIWLRIEGREAVCPYCSRTYRLKDGAGEDGHH